MLLDMKQNKHFNMEIHTSVIMMKKKKPVLISFHSLNALLQDIWLKRNTSSWKPTNDAQ